MDTNDKRPPVHGSGAYWASKSENDLEYQMRGSMVGGPAYEGARAELDRRAANRRSRTDRWIAIVSLIAASIAAVASIMALR